MKKIIIAFANLPQAPLQSVTEEDEGIHNTLIAANRGDYSVHRESFATVSNINNAFSTYGAEIAIFHYAGHAGEQSLLFIDQAANGQGLAYLLKPSADAGALRLVILNGCSTGAQVDQLLALGVPAVIATSSAVNDLSARIFGVEFFKNICTKGMSIRQAFDAALKSAQLASQVPLGVDAPPARDLNLPGKTPREPFWGLFFNNAAAVDVNPLPSEPNKPLPPYEPNAQLTQALFNALVKDGNLPAKQIDDRRQTEIIEDNMLQKTILDVLPHPIAIQLKTLFAAEYGAEGLKQPGIKRLEQIGRAFHIASEFMGIIMISQLWELKITQKVENLPDEMMELLDKYFGLSIADRSVYDYSALIRSIRKYIDSLADVQYFVSELSTLRDDDPQNKPFSEACVFLQYIRSATYTGFGAAGGQQIPEAEVPALCIRAEDMLSTVFERLGFLHRYTLTSIQNIRINKYRHDTLTVFDHQVVKLMNSNASHEINYYLLAHHLDNSGVVLTKQALPVFNVERRQYKGDSLEFLNLSPLVVDVNTFESRSDRSNLVIFGQYQPADDTYVFRTVPKPDEPLDHVRININRRFARNEQQEQGRYEAICQQLTAFRQFAQQALTPAP
ncbi:CHAT domain-containing protein [Chitinophaga sp. NPDC101104]|uniref:CHAT domain-containing protein n=1 Tax=Chitinophaga sp. NPDC101104 TaxID=3390561 RepID=UPI003CFC678E